VHNCHLNELHSAPVWSQEAPANPRRAAVLVRGARGEQAHEQQTRSGRGVAASVHLDLMEAALQKRVH
jgi:hypothetical protein